MLPVPSFIRDLEQHEKEAKNKTLAELKSAGVDLEQIPAEELEAGDGEAIVALKRWYSYVDSLEERGRTDRVNQLADLKSRIEAWRLDMAERFRMAPASVMDDALSVKIAYATATMNVGRMERDALIAVGVRSNGIDELITVLGQWTAKQEEAKSEAASGGSVNVSKELQMSFEEGNPFKPNNSWRYAVYKPNKKTGEAAWEASYNRFSKGEHPQTIAMQQKSGKPIQVGTVVGHILEALTQGRSVDLHKLSSSAQPPTKQDWETLTRCELETGMDVTGDPATSGANNERFIMKDFLVPVMGNAFAVKDYKERTAEESATFSRWCGNLNWYLALRRVGFEPSFEP